MVHKTCPTFLTDVLDFLQIDATCRVTRVVLRVYRTHTGMPLHHGTRYYEPRPLQVLLECSDSLGSCTHRQFCILVQNKPALFDSLARHGLVSKYSSAVTERPLGDMRMALDREKKSKRKHRSVSVRILSP